MGGTCMALEAEEARRWPARVRACRHTDATLRAAVALWFSDNAAAVARYGPIGDWDTRDVKSMRELFKFRVSFDDDIGRWNVSGVKNMDCMFQNAASCNQPLDKWDVADGTSKTCMFDGARSFKQPATLKRFGLVLPSPSRAHACHPTLSAVANAHGS